MVDDIAEKKEAKSTAGLNEVNTRLEGLHTELRRKIKDNKESFNQTFPASEWERDNRLTAERATGNMEVKSEAVEDMSRRLGSWVEFMRLSKEMGGDYYEPFSEKEQFRIGLTQRGREEDVEAVVLELGGEIPREEIRKSEDMTRNSYVVDTQIEGVQVKIKYDYNGPAGTSPKQRPEYLTMKMDLLVEGDTARKHADTSRPQDHFGYKEAN